MFEFSEDTRIMTVYSYSAITGEFLSEANALILPNMGLPADATITPPPKTKKNHVAVWNGEKWTLTPDYRGTTIFNTETRDPRIINELGPIPDGFTTLAPGSQYDIWTGKAWRYDATAEQAAQVASAEQMKRDALRQANDEIQILSFGIDAGLATDDEKARYDALKRYAFLLSRVDTSTAPDIDWPETI